MEIIRALVEHGADIQLPNHFGGEFQGIHLKVILKPFRKEV